MKKISLPRYRAGELSTDFAISPRRAYIGVDIEWDEHSHSTHELLWNESGASTAVVEGRMWTITRHCGLWVPAGIPHAGQTPQGIDHREAHFHIAAFSETPQWLRRPISISMSPLLRLLLERLEDSSLASAERARTEAVVCDVLAPRHDPPSVGLPTHGAVQEMVKASLAHPERHMTLEYWAKQLNVSSRTISRILREECGLGYSQWIAAIRISRAMQLLGEGMSVETVSSLVGYSSATAFGTAFRRLVGMSPGQFRGWER